MAEVQTLPRIRAATPDDAGEVLRLAYLMWEEMGVSGRPGDWEVEYQKVFATEVGGDRMRVAVAEHPTHAGVLVGCGVAWTYPLLPSFWLIKGQMGYLQWFYTDSTFRRRGIASAILDELVDWLREHGCTRVQLHSAPAAERLYYGKGFVETDFKNLWLRVREKSDS